MSLKELEYIWLSRIKISNKLKMYLIEKFGNIHEFYNCSLDDLIYFDVSSRDINEILDINLRRNLNYEYNLLNKNNIGILSCEDEKYPDKLKKIDDYPIILFYKGNIDILDYDSVGIVGSRVAFKESLEKSRSIAREISNIGINVISGLARGVDKFAHLGCMDINFGKTIAVLGSGIDKKSFYPKENYRVYERIIENGGCILTEYPIGTEPIAYNFPYRNRIISGLSDKIIIIQAGCRSGSLITVDFALEQGKDILVIPPLKNSNLENFRGNIELIKQGARIYKNINDLLLNSI